MKNTNLRPEALYPVYPPYHQGFYLEEYFFNWIKKNNIKIKREYIDIFWTNIYCNAASKKSQLINIQSELNELDPSKSYFTICQHDDGPLENLPNNTLIFRRFSNGPSSC